MHIHHLKEVAVYEKSWVIVRQILLQQLGASDKTRTQVTIYPPLVVGGSVQAQLCDRQADPPPALGGTGQDQGPEARLEEPPPP